MITAFENLITNQMYCSPVLHSGHNSSPSVPLLDPIHSGWNSLLQSPSQLTKESPNVSHTYKIVKKNHHNRLLSHLKESLKILYYFTFLCKLVKFTLFCNC